MKRTHTSHVRAKIVALLLALAALWTFAAYVTVRDGLNMLSVNTIGQIGYSTSAVVDALQVERRLSVVALSRDASGIPEELADSRERTDALVAEWHDEAGSRALRMAASDQLMERVAQTGDALARLGEVRSRVSDGETNPGTAMDDYTDIIDISFDIYVSMASLDDEDIARQLRALIALSQGRELLSQQDAVIAQALAADEVTSADIADFTKLVGARRYQYDNAVAGLHPDDLAFYEQTVAQDAVTRLHAIEDQFIAEAEPGGSPPFPAARWQETVAQATVDLQNVETIGTENVVARATPVAVGVIVRLLLAGGLGLIAVIAAVVISITTARALVRQLERLRDAALELAHRRLPLVVERLSAGEKVDVATEAPPLRFGDDEIGQVGQAFNAVQETAVRAAVQQADLRRGVRDVFLSLARRTQSLVHKQLSVVDGMERRETDADEMEEIYRIDHLATRMRRNAENLIVLSGASPGRTWRRSVTMIDVIRGAVAEVEDYTRVGLLPVDDAFLDGRAVGDVIHLLAELIENAASFSPPYARVSVGGQRVAHGFVVEIEDRGLGMSAADLAAANETLSEPPDFSLADASRLGHYVVAKLAQRHGIKVHLRPSPYGGVVAIVLVPAGLLTDTSRAVTQPALEASAAEVAVPEGPVAAPGTATAELPVAAAGAVTTGVNGERIEGIPATVVRPRRAPESRPPSPAAPPPPPAAAPPPPPPTTAAAPPPPAASPPAEPSPDAAGPPEPEVRTPAGLPWRVRQASLPKQLQADADRSNGHHYDVNAGQHRSAEPASESTVDEVPERDPEQVREMMRAYQHGTKLGRDSAAGTGTGTGTEDQPAQEG